VANGCFPYPAIDLGEHVCRDVLLTHWAFAYSNSGLANGVTNPPLTAQADSAVGGNGIYSLAFPTLTYEATNCFVDVFFTPAAGQTPVLSLSFDPANSSIASTTPLGTTVATIVATWSDGQPTGTLGFGPPKFDAGGAFSIIGNRLLINPRDQM
jgi:hypothetical protein